MKETGVTIFPAASGYMIQAVGRANFDYAVPVRDLTRDLDGSENICIDLSRCTAMDSTFMGVLSMMGLKARRNGGKIEIAGAEDHLKALLRGLGIAKLFEYIDQVPAMPDAQPSAAGSAADTAATVLEAHETLVEADAENAAKFEQVIKFAREDVERLKK